MIDKEYLNECFSYNSSTGELSWRDRPLSHFKNEKSMKLSNIKTNGRVVDSIQINKNGKEYIKLSIRAFGVKHQFLAHRVIWMMVNGEWPECIDHINGNSTDNRMCNLRSVTVTENNRNMRLFKTNTTGAVGVYANNKGSWTSYIWDKNKQINIGTYETRAEAAAARAGAEKVLRYHQNHGANHVLSSAIRQQNTADEIH
tara:strand:+ start:253 stop:852 length:600 start_codon:yes stop_codon:yes gene_type:complete